MYITQWRKAVPVLLAAMAVGCNSAKDLKPTSKQRAEINTETKFSSKEYGVAGSPRVTTRKQVRKGGGRYQIGKPYKIRGRWYKPKLEPNYSKVGMASWYGPNFHGRLTANGEVYDQYSLSAAHPTMPLPSYARVTNVENGSSVIVRVNDRGPYAHGRIIDLSARAAKLLNYEKQGVAKVRVKYLGKARMDGLDEKYLVASYKGGRGQPKIAPGGSFAGTLFAKLRKPQAEQPANRQTTIVASAVPEQRPYGINLYDGLPIELNGTRIVREEQIRLRKPLAYAPTEETGTGDVFAKVLGSEDSGVLAASQFHLGTFASWEQARTIKSHFVGLGQVTIDSDRLGNDQWFSVSVKLSVNDREKVVRLANSLALHEAFEVRNR